MIDSPKTLLLVEDEELLALTETRWLTKAGYKIIHVPDGEGAIRIVKEKKEKIDLILMDINLGAGIDGTQAAEEILKINDIPILFLSSHTEKKVVQKAEKITSYGYVVKSSNDVVLLASIKMAFRLHDANKEIIEQKQALLLTERKYSTAFYTSPDSISITRLSDGVFLEINEGFTKITGYSPADVIGRATLPDDLGIWVNIEDRNDMVQQLTEKGELTNRETPFRAKDGRIVTGLLSAKIIDVEGEKCLLAIVRDISARKAVLEQLKTNEENFRRLLELAPDAFLQGDPKGNLILVNDQACTLTGYSKEELLKMNMKDFFSEETIRTKPLRYDLLDRGETIRAERELIKKDGRTTSVEMNSKKMPDGTFQSFIQDISHRKLIEEKLSASEKKYRELFEKSEDAILIIQNGKFVDCNDATVKMLRYGNKEELLNTHPSELSPEKQPDGRHSFEKADDMMKTALENGSHRFEWDHKKADGEIFPVEVLLTAVNVDENNKILHTIWRDITERKKFEKELFESQKNYKDLIEKMLDGVYKSTHEGKFLEINDAMVKMLGYDDKEDLYSIDIKSQLYFHESDRESAALEEKMEEMAVFRLKKKDGSEIWVEDHGRHVLDEFGNVLYHEGVMRDVTERVRAEEEIRQSEEKFRAIFENNSAAIAIINYDGTIAMVNEAYCQMSGYKKEEVIGLNWTKQIPAEDLDRMLEYNRRRLQNPLLAPDKYEFSFYKKNGDLRYGLISVSLSPSSQKIITSFIDITDRKLAEIQREKFTEELKSINATKDKFFSIISHDLKNPFQSINGSIKLILNEDDPLTQEEKHTFLTNILRTSDKAYLLLENLLIWSQNEMGKMEFEPEKIDLMDAVSNCMDLLKSGALLKSITARNKITKGVYVQADRNLLDTVMRNLITNAIKFTRENGKIEISSVSNNGMVEVSVADSGVGIEENDLAKLFRIDKSFSTTGTKNEAGTGLGLILCKEFVEKHGGKIWIESKIGKGTKISFTLPAYL